MISIIWHKSQGIGEGLRLFNPAKFVVDILVGMSTMEIKGIRYVALSQAVVPRVFCSTDDPEQMDMFVCLRCCNDSYNTSLLKWLTLCLAGTSMGVGFFLW
jgi:hypothetical protein